MTEPKTRAAQSPQNPASMRQRRHAAAIAFALLSATCVAGAATNGGAGPSPAGAPTPLALTPTQPDRFAMLAPKGSQSGPVQARMRIDRESVLQGRDGLVRAELILDADERATEGADAVPTDFVVVLDRSGSMSGDKIEHARAAIRGIISQLSTRDRFALISYASDAGVNAPLNPATPEHRDIWIRTLDRVPVGGGTNLGAGLGLLGSVFVPEEAELARLRARRILVISDGLINEGATSMESLAARVAVHARAERVVSTIGVGADFDETMMTRLADVGTGNYYYLRSATDLAGVLESEFLIARETVASAVEVEIAPMAGTTLIDAGGYPLERRGEHFIFRPGTLFSGQQRRIWLSFRVDTREAGTRELGEVVLRFRDGDDIFALDVGALPKISCVADAGKFYEGINKDAWSRSVAGEEWSQVQQQVATSVREGKREEALGYLRDYSVRNSTMNGVVQSTDVDDALADAAALEEEVQAAFSGRGQARKRNVLSKSLSSSGYLGRRVGTRRR